MPFSDVTDFLKLLDIWIQVGMGWNYHGTELLVSLFHYAQNGWEIELSCRCLFFLLRWVTVA